ncbi:unnamed protein product [marine sediment metagenome]|uniref:Uncharacterized protein n=1 Tax=marine sediment metagenome TaxID=412755 RepID=X1DQ89_9ZZZZ
MQKIPFTKQEIKQLKIKNELHFQSNLQQLFAMIPKRKDNGKK